MAYDDIIIATGGFGRHQRRIYVLLCLCLIPCAYHTMAGVFLQGETDFRCLLPYESRENATYNISSNISSIFFPWNNEDKGWSQCERYDINYTDQLYDLDLNLSSTAAPTIKCNSYVYDKSTYELTTTTEFNLVCGNSWLRATADALFMVGAMVGSTIFGGLSDIYGRKPIFYWSLCLQAISGLCVAASPEVFSYIVFRFVLGASGSGIFQISYVNAVEMVVPEKRSVVGIGIQLFYTLGYIITAGFAYFLTSWRMLQIALTVPCLTFLIYWWFIPESTRWLVTTGRLEEARYYIQKACVKNGVELSSDTLDTMLSECSLSKTELENFSIFDLLKYPNLRRKSFLICLNGFVITTTYFGLAWNTSSLVGNIYINFAISGLVEIPSCILVFLTLDRWGRKKILCGSTILSGVFLILTIFVPVDLSWLNVTLTMMAKLSITASYVAMYVFAAEQYPTVIRNVGLGMCATFASIGGIISPYIIYSSVVWGPLSVLILGTSTLMAGFLALLLPETLNQKLPESIKDGEEFGKKIAKLDKASSC